MMAAKMCITVHISETCKTKHFTETRIIVPVPETCISLHIVGSCRIANVTELCTAVHISETCITVAETILAWLL